MRTIAALLAAFPLFAAAQAAPPPQTWATEPSPAAAPAPAAEPAPAPAAQPAPAQPAYAPPPQAAPPAPAPQYAPPPRYGPPPQYAPARRGPQRDSWYIGFGLGGGDGKVADATRTADFRDLHPAGPTNVFFNFNVGGTMTPRLLLGLDMGVITSGSTSRGVTTSVGVVNFDAMATYFPWERGFFVKGGLGRSAVTHSVDDAFGTSTSGAGGWNVAGGIGYAWWLGQQFNLTANLEFSRQWYSATADATGPTVLEPITDSQFWALWVGFDWY